jgi:hypothetical protein
MTTPAVDLEARGRQVLRWLASDDGARWAFLAMLPVTIVVFYVVGRHQWFTRDDWGYVLTLEGVLKQQGWQHWLFSAQDGHWLTVPILVFHATNKTFGIDSYWPYLLTRVLCRRLQVSAWTTTIVCSMLLVFGSGWDNIVFAIQICFNLSLVCFLAQVLLVDHDGPPDRRDVLGALLALVGVMSSGFGPIFVVAVTVLLVLRRRWRALLIGVGPAAATYAWWLVSWYDDGVAARLPGDRVQVAAYLERGVTATFESLVSIPALAGLALLATLAVALWRGVAWTPRTLMLSLWSVLVVMFLAIGWERIGFGVPTAASSRYMHISGIVIAPVLAVAVDRLATLATEARWAGRAILVASIAVNAGALRTNASTWAQAARAEQDLFELIAGSPEVLAADPKLAPAPLSPNVTIGSLGFLIIEGAINPRPPATDEERQRVLTALGLGGGPAP